MAQHAQEPGAAAGVVVRPMTVADADFAARLHRASLPHGFFRRLGRGFLREYYRGFVLSPHGIALLASVDQRACGTLVGTASNRAHYRWVLRHRGGRLAGLAGAALLRRPRLSVVLVRTRLGRYARAAWRLCTPGPSATPADAAHARPAVLTHAAVAPHARGRGAGSALVRAFHAAARARGASRARLVTLDGPGGASEFYRARGWRRTTAVRDWDGHDIVVLECELDGADAGTTALSRSMPGDRGT